MTARGTAGTAGPMAPTATVEPPAKRPRLEPVDLKLKSGDILEGGLYLSESMEAAPDAADDREGRGEVVDEQIPAGGLDSAGTEAASKVFAVFRVTGEYDWLHQKEVVH